ncbi:MAG: hypothetical protein M1830_004963 [Pleopsidium flavum]|nr:MAG: hypothetical protein M1830_004963 [Pleopsidium flavum]
MGLAVAGGGSGLDMGGELKHRSWQWEPPTITGGLGSDRSPALPSWLANFVPTDEPKPECHQQKPPGLGTALNEFNKHHSVDFEIRLRLGFCTNVESIARLLKELGIGMQDITTYSRLAFDHLLQKDANLESVIKYLEDPTINVPAAENLLRYIESLKDHHLSTSELAELCRYAEQAVVLGLISEIEIRSISRVASVINSISDLDTALPMFEGVQLIQSIWTGFQHSAVFPAKDLEGLTLNLLLCHLAKGSYTEGNRSLVASIVASATQAQLRHMTEGISIYLAAWYRNGMVREVDNPELDYQANVIPGLADFIDSLPLAIARSSLASATVALISHNEDGEVGAAQSVLLFRKWMMSLVQSAQFKASVIGSSEWQVIEQSFGRPKHSNYVSLYLDQFIEVDQCRFILRNWVPEHVQPAGGLTEDLICSAVRRQFDELCPAQEGTHCYSSLILALCRTQQPYHQIFHDLLWVLRDSARPEAVLQTIEQLQILQVPLQPSILGAEVRRYSAISVRVALRIFELHLALKLEGSMDFVLALINDPSSHVDTTFRLLKRHQKSTKNNRRNVRTFPQARSRLLHKMATAFAHASHLRPRVAFRKVYQCYLHLHKEGFVLRAEIARALTHAGIVRGLQAGQRVSTMQIKWILRKVQEVEGDQVEKDVDSTVYHWRGIVLQRLGRQRYKDMLRTALKMGSR